MSNISVHFYPACFQTSAIKTEVLTTFAKTMSCALGKEAITHFKQVLTKDFL